MERSEFIARTKVHLAEYLQCRGCFIYSASESFASNPLLVYGLNPGQNYAKNPEHESNARIGQSIADFEVGQRNLLVEQNWLTHRGRPYPKGGSPYQLRVTNLLRFLGQPNALVTNLIFEQTPRERDLPPGEDGRRLMDACWKVHQDILETTGARTMVALGGTTFTELKRRLNSSEDEELFPSGHGTWTCRRCCAVWGGRRIVLVGLPHFSCYKVDAHDPVMNWVAQGM